MLKKFFVISDEMADVSAWRLWCPIVAPRYIVAVEAELSKTGGSKRASRLGWINEQARMPGLTCQPGWLLCYCLLSRRKRYAPRTMKSTLGNQTSSSGWIFAFARMVSAMMMKRK